MSGDALAAALGHHQAGRLPQAEAIYRQVLRAQPDHPGALHLLGVLAHQVGRHQVAADLISRAILLSPLEPAFHSNLGSTLKALGRLEEAVAAFESAIALRPSYAEAHYNLGGTLRLQGRLEEAVASLERAVALDPSSADAHYNLGTTLLDLRRLDRALASFERALALHPAYAMAHVSAAIVHLLCGDLEQGFAAYEWRWRCADFANPSAQLPQPRWDGRPLAGRTVLLQAEQGFGDTLQFVRYAPLVAARGGRVVLQCQPELRRLLDGLPGVDRVVEVGAPLPAFDLHVPLLNLPHLLGTNLETIPAAAPYLRADADRAAAWRERLGRLPGLRVGLVWAGNPGHKQDRHRSLSRASLAPLARVPGVSFVSLQKSAAPPASPPTQAPPTHQPPPDGLPLLDLAPQLGDFAETAAVLQSLDLVVTVDTAVAHLAGALGRPAWVLLAFAADWRWLLDREDSPWYPSLRLFRQPRPGDWESVVDRVADALARLAAARGQWSASGTD